MSIFQGNPQSEADLLQRCQAISGLTLGQIAARLSVTISEDPLQRKGSVGMLLEQALGTTAKQQALPDFHHLQIELKTLPIGIKNQPTESTFITSIPLLTIHQQCWESSTCYIKLKRILWIPIETHAHMPFYHRRVGMGFLWSPSVEEYQVLKEDWSLLTTMIATGNILGIDARLGKYLQIRPKAAHGSALCSAYNSSGQRIQTLPRGFYLRRVLTTRIWKKNITQAY